MNKSDVGLLDLKKVLKQAIDTTSAISGLTCLYNILPDDELIIDVVFSGVNKKVTLEGTLD